MPVWVVITVPEPVTVKSRCVPNQGMGHSLPRPTPPVFDHHRHRTGTSPKPGKKQVSVPEPVTVKSRCVPNQHPDPHITTGGHPLPRSTPSAFSHHRHRTGTVPKPEKKQVSAPEPVTTISRCVPNQHPDPHITGMGHSLPRSTPSAFGHHRHRTGTSPKPGKNQVSVPEPVTVKSRRVPNQHPDPHITGMGHSLPRPTPSAFGHHRHRTGTSPKPGKRKHRPPNR
jgi:hypothetical protein